MMEKKELSILIVEDDPEDLFFIKRALDRSESFHIRIEHADSLSDAFNKIDHHSFEVFLLDLSLPDSLGIDTFEKMHEKVPQLPIIVLTGANDEDLARKTVSKGAQDYLIKGEVRGSLLVRAIQYAIERKNSDIQLRKTIAALEAANQKIITQQQSLIEEERHKVLLQMAGSTAHELNQPLMVMLGNLELMELDEDNRQTRMKYIEKARSAGQRIADTVRKIQNIQHYETKDYAGDQKIINLDQDIHILAVEDSDMYFCLLKEFLRKNISIQMHQEKGLQGGLAFVKQHQVDLVLLDYILDDGNGLQFLRALDEEKIDLPVIMITGHGDEVVASQAIQIGAFDYISKQKLNENSLNRIVKNTLEKFRLKLEVKQTVKILAETAVRDSLTGLYSRKLFMESLEREINAAKRYHHPLSLCILELDHFKTVNEQYGHPCGDMILKTFAELILEAIRRSDLPCRNGGNKFILSLPETDMEGAFQLSERFRKSIAKHVFALDRHCLKMTVSIGVASTRSELDITPNQILASADHALFQAKSLGGNRVMKSEPGPVDGQ